MPPSKKQTERNGRILAEYLEGDVTQKQLADKYNVPAPTVASIIYSARKRLVPDMTKVKSTASELMTKRITESLEKQIILGESMMDRAMSNVGTAKIKDVSQLSVLAKTGADIARKGYGIKEDDTKVTAIQINLSVPIQLGADKIDNINSVFSLDKIENPLIAETVETLDSAENVNDSETIAPPPV